MLTLWSVMASATARSHVLLGISTMSLVIPQALADATAAYSSSAELHPCGN